MDKGGGGGGEREREVELWQEGQRTPCNRAPLVGVANLFSRGRGGGSKTLTRLGNAIPMPPQMIPSP